MGLVEKNHSSKEEVKDEPAHWTHDHGPQGCQKVGRFTVVGISLAQCSDAYARALGRTRKDPLVLHASSVCQKSTKEIVDLFRIRLTALLESPSKLLVREQHELVSGPAALKQCWLIPACDRITLSGIQSCMQELRNWLAPYTGSVRWSVDCKWKLRTILLPD